MRALDDGRGARASSPVIHFDSPDGSAILPSIDSASLSVIRGRPSSSRVSQPASERFAASRPDAERHLDAGARAAARMPLPEVRGSGSLSAIDDARRLGREQQIGAGRPARAVVRAGLERDIDRRSRRALAGLLRARRPRRAAGRRPRSRPCRRSRPSARRSRSRHWGWARCGRARPRRARAPRAMKRRRLLGQLNPELFSSFWNCRCFSFSRRLHRRLRPSSGRR